ncbi:MAG TPA: NAD-dependent epimerase/dehydratase family protein [Opitutaceae bacterium]|nr:NAD-dependent epimerase/dehydratase family protein [Opitutaceae bacterium]
MKILFLGGTGIISTACVELAIARGFDVTVLNRANRGPISGARQITADIGGAAVAAALGHGRWDAVIDFLAYDPRSIEQRLGLFRGKTGHYVFISSASAYEKPLSHYLITESTPLANPFWDYSRNKIASEERLMRAWREEHFPMTIIRPSLTYGDTVVPLAVNSWAEKSFTAVARLRAGKPLIVPGDGLSLWTITHNSDFAKALVGLLGNVAAMGTAVHITSDEVLTWNQIYQQTAEAAGVAEPRLVHIASDFITACLPEMTGTLTGDKSNSAIFDNTKVKRLVPDYVATTRYRDGIKRTIRWFDADPRRQIIDEPANAAWDKLLSAYEGGLSAARAEFGQK